MNHERWLGIGVALFMTSGFLVMAAVPAYAWQPWLGILLATPMVAMVVGGLIGFFVGVWRAAIRDFRNGW